MGKNSQTSQSYRLFFTLHVYVGYSLFTFVHFKMEILVTRPNEMVATSPLLLRNLLLKINITFINYK